MKTIITLDKANQPYGFPQLNGNGDFNNIIVDGGLSATTISATTYQNLPSNSLYSLPVPNLKIQKTPTTIETLDTNSSYAGYNQIGSGVTFDLTAVVITNDISEEQINNGVWLEMLLYRRNKKNQKNAKGFVVPPSYSWDGSTSANTLQNELLSLYPTLKITSRGGSTLYYIQNPLIKEPLRVSRPNHQRVTGITQTINVTNYLNGRFTYRNLEYRNENGDPTITSFKVPHPLKIKGNVFNDNTTSRFCYSSRLTPTYATFRYIMFNPNINNGKGGFITGPLSKTLKVTLESFPLIPSTPVYKFGKFYSTCTVVPNYSGFENKLRFSIESNVP